MLKTFTIAEGILLLVLGFLALIFPVVASFGVTAVVGIAFLLGGIIGWINNISRRHDLKAWLVFWRLVVSTLFLIAGFSILQQISSGPIDAAAQVLALAAGYTHILCPATAGGKNVAPRVAARLDVGQVSDITRVDSPDTFERPIYAGNAMATVQATDAVKVITVRTTGFDPATSQGGTAVIEVVNAVADSGKSRYVGSEIA